MIDYLHIGSTPHAENCAQVGSAEYSIKARAECKRFVAQIERHYPIPEGAIAYLKVKANPHDFGTYYDIALIYDTDNEEHTKWVSKVEGELPNKWDFESRTELEKEGYYLHKRVIR